MLQAKSFFLEDVKNRPYLFLNLVFGFFPISFIIGTLIVNLNLLVFCCLGIYYLKSKIITTKFNFSIKIINHKRQIYEYNLCTTKNVRLYQIQIMHYFS